MIPRWWDLTGKCDACKADQAPCGNKKKRGNGEFYSGKCFLIIHSDLGVTMDPCH